jgi:SAM-dependent methyltransferase
VKEYYGKIITKTEDLKTCACVPSAAPNSTIRDILKLIPNEIKSKFYGCGNPIPLGIQGLHILDLGSGSGRDDYIAAKLVGPEGSVTGIDMTDEQLEVANRYVEEYCCKTLGYTKPNLKFVKGYIEFLEEAGIPKQSMDMVISNCVVNLSPNKKQVLQSVYNVLKQGGEFYFSDVYCDRRLPQAVRDDPILYGECLGGALYINDFLALCKQIGFADPRIVSQSNIDIGDEQLQDLIGEARFSSITFRLFKLDNLEPNCEDYGQVAVYKGTIPGYKSKYMLDDHHIFETGKPALVCGNTASMLSETWLKKYFTVTGDRSVHFGVFPCGDANNTKSNNSTPCCSEEGGGCCG